MSSKRDAAVTDSTGITPLVKRDALLFTDHTKNGTLRPVRCAAEADSAAVAALVNCFPSGLPRQRVRAVAFLIKRLIVTLLVMCPMDDGPLQQIILLACRW